MLAWQKGLLVRGTPIKRTHDPSSSVPIVGGKANVSTPLPKCGMPDTFDVRTAFPYSCPAYNTPIVQGKCFACWAISGTAVFSDRLCIATKGVQSILLSAEHALSCAPGDQTCGGAMRGEHDLSTEFAAGVTTEDCDPYLNQKPPYKFLTDDACHFKVCDRPGVTPVAYKGTTYEVGDTDTPAERDIMYHLKTKGEAWVPIYVCNDTITDCHDAIALNNLDSDQIFKCSAWVPHPNDIHYIRIMGWGSLNGEDYWLAHNPWGKVWPFSGKFKNTGFFMISRSADGGTCGVQQGVYSVDPIIPCASGSCCMFEGRGFCIPDGATCCPDYDGACVAGTVCCKAADGCCPSDQSVCPGPGGKLCCDDKHPHACPGTQTCTNSPCGCNKGQGIENGCNASVTNGTFMIPHDTQWKQGSTSLPVCSDPKK